MQITTKMQTPDDKHHEELVQGLYNQMKPVLEKSEQPMFIYLDDNHKACNVKFAEMLGYKSPKDWADNQGFLDIFVDEKSRETLMNAYWNAMNKMVASTISLTWMKNNGSKIDSTMILVPMHSEGHMFSVHFVTSFTNK